MSPGNTPIKRQAKRPKAQLIREAEKLTEFSDWFRKTAQKYNPELFEQLPAFEAAPKLGVLLTDTNKAFAQIQEIFAKIVRQAPPSLNSELLHKQKELSNLTDIRKFNITRLGEQQQIFYSIANLLDETITLVTGKTVSEKKDKRRQARKEGKAGGKKDMEQQEEDGQSKTDDIPTLTEDEAQVLNYLNEEHPQIRYQQDIVAVCKRDRKTIRVCLKKLMECRFVSLPESKKKGYVITSDGKDYLNKHF